METERVLVTGANSGLGFSTCCRLIDEFLYLRPPTQSLEIIVTTRSLAKGQESIKRLQHHLEHSARRLRKDGKGSEKALQGRVAFRNEILDLCRLKTVKQLASALGQEQLKIDSVILNAGIGGWTGIDWPVAIYLVLTDLVYSVTYPASFKKGAVGLVAKPQTQGVGEPPLAEVFCANFFGHYMLAHWLMPLLAKSQHGRVIWLSSNEAYPRTLSLDDVQAFTSPEAYESSKRLTDVLAISSRLPGPREHVEQFESVRNELVSIPEKQLKSRPKQYVVQPGVCATSIIDLPFLLVPLMQLAFLLARWLGSIWHCVDPYKGATGPVWLALVSQETLEAMEKRDGISKWGSAVDRWGEERVERAEVEGWGFTGKVEDMALVKTRKGRMRGLEPVTQKDREHFDAEAIECWKKVEELRLEWEARLAQ